ncbi:MAG: hypothetical protein LBH74_08355 [Nitrososphaerota archaeon]|nr:hypothetical protein [Nitrososphaerota archaeon]
MPFLALKGSFDYWKNTKNGDQRQKHLLAVLNAIDIDTDKAVNASNAAYANIAYGAAADAAYGAAADAVADAVAAKAVAVAAVDVARVAAYATDYAAFVKAAADDKTALAVRATAAAKAAEYAATKVVRAAAYAAGYAAKAAGEYAIDLKSILLEDLESIETGAYKFQNNTIIYGALWQNFQSALRDLGCAYWGDWYARLFNKGFIIDNGDRAEIYARLNVPSEVMGKGAAVVARYLLDAKKQGELVYVNRETRLIILGSAGAGKTTLVRRLNGDFSDPTPEESTHGVDTTVELDINGVNTRVWDFGGQVIYHASHRCFMSANCVYILVVNARDEEFRDIGRLNYWLDTIRIYSENKAKVFIVLNESDNRSQNLKDFSSFKEGEYASIVQEFYGFNVRNDAVGLSAFKNDLTAYIESVGHQTFGKNDRNAMCDVKTLFEQNKKILKKDEFQKILENNNIKKHDQKRVVELFDTLGVALSYDFMADYVIDPYWISHGVYKVIDYLQKNKTGFIKYSEDVLDVVFADEHSTYPKKDRAYIFELMEYHRIGFHNKSGIRGLLVPCAASRFVPADVINSAKSDSLITHVERDTLDEIPADFFYSFVCENKDDIETRKEMSSVWQEGMVLAGNRASATVIISQNRRIEITVWGEEKETYRDMLEKCMDDLLKEYNFSAIKAHKERGGKIINIISLVLSATSAVKGIIV